MKVHTAFRLGELFCGPGGLALATITSSLKTNKESYSIRHMWANDLDQDSCATYRRNICPKNPSSVICSNIRKLDITKLSPIDAFAFGFPCNDFSVVGEQKGINGEYGPLYTYGVRVIKHFQPKWFLAENVGGLRSSNNGKAFKKILRDLAECGYCLTAHLYNFEKYSVPQTRRRIIIVGIKESLGLTFRVPAPEGQPVSSRTALSNPPIPPDAPNQEKTKHAPLVIKRLKHIKAGQNAWNANLPEYLRLNVKKVRLSHIYKRLDPNKPAYTITGSGGGGTHVYHWSENRALTNRERARLQTFPDDFRFIGSKESVRKQIGMAVPVKGARRIFQAILKTFAGTEYPFVRPNIGYITKKQASGIVDLPHPTFFWGRDVFEQSI